MTTKKTKKPKITAKKWMGDDAASWAVFIDGKPFIEGLTRGEVPYYKKIAAERAQEALPPIKSLTDLKIKAKFNNDYRRLVIVALENLGCEHLARGTKTSPKWEAYYQGLETYLMSLVSEYGEYEDDAEKGLIDEINNVRACINQAKLEW